MAHFLNAIIFMYCASNYEGWSLCSSHAAKVLYGTDDLSWKLLVWIEGG